jgi:hypothetical protein
MSVALTCLVSYPALARQDNGNGPGEIPFEIARLIIEYNATDEDVGVQVLLDGGSSTSSTSSGRKEIGSSR